MNPVFAGTTTTTWNPTTVNANYNFFTVAHGNGQWYALDNAGAIAKLADGASSWDTTDSVFCSPTGDAYFNSNWYILCQDGQIFSSSSTFSGKNHIYQFSRASDFESLTTNGSVLIAAGADTSSGTAGYVMSSSDGTNWSENPVGSTQLYSVRYGNGEFVAVGANESIYHSTDGVSWAASTVTNPTGATLWGVTYGNGLYVAVGDSGTILTSKDAITWTSVTSGTTNVLYSVAYGANKFVAVGVAGTIVSTTDSNATSWAPEQTQSQNLYTVTYDAGEFMAVGDSGLVVTQVPPLSQDATLKALAVDQGNLVQTFDPATTAYTESVGNGVTQLTVTGTKNDPTATVTVSGNSVVGTDSATIPLNVGVNTITVHVVAQDPNYTKDYTITVTRAASTDATLKALTVDHGSLDQTFDPATTTYTESVPYTVSQLTVTGTKNDTNATVTVSGNGATGTDSATIPLTAGTSTTITVHVVAQDTSHTQDYTLTVTRAAGSQDDTLKDLTVDQGSLDQTFASGTTTYTESVPYTVSQLTVTGTKNDPTATVTVSGNAATGTDSATIPLSVGSSNVITVHVVAQDTSYTKDYTLTVTRAAASQDATLKALTVDQGSMDQAFDPATTTYTETVPYNVTQLTVTGTKNDPTATVTVSGNSVTGTDNAAIPLSVGSSNVITVHVVAQDTSYTKDYTLTVTRQSNNADLSNLQLSVGTLDHTFGTAPIDTYTAAVVNATTSVDVTPTLADTTATVTINDQPATNGQAFTVSLNPGNNVITVKTVSQDKTVTKTYTVTVTRQSNVADLSDLQLSAGTLDHAFGTAPVDTYTANVTYATSTLDLTPVLTDSTATVTINDQPATNNQANPVTLNPGDNVITIKTVSQDQSVTKTYTLTVTRQSNNADMSDLQLSAGTLDHSFGTAPIDTYSADVPNATTTVDVTPTLADSTATMTINDQPATSGQAFTVSLNPGDNVITIKTFSQDNTVTNTYTVTVTRQSNDADLKDLQLSSGTLDPTFGTSSDNTYSVSVVNSVDHLDVTPVLDEGHATVTIDGLSATNNQPTTVNLNPVTTTFTVVVTSQDGTVTNTYQLTVTRLSADATLSDLQLSDGTNPVALSPAFGTSTDDTYTATVVNSVDKIDVTPFLHDSNATVTVNGKPAADQTATEVNLTTGDNSIDVVVKSQDGTATTTYHLTVTRQSNDADLMGLVASDSDGNVQLNPSFDSSTTDYTVTVANSIDQIGLIPMLDNTDATMTVNGVAATDSQPAYLPLTVGDNPIEIVVTSQDKTKTKTYTVTVTRLSNDANLSSLTVDGATLDRAFDPNMPQYAATVANSVDHVDVTPVVDDSTATLTVNDQPATSGQPVTVSLVQGSNTIFVKVTAQDGTSKTYAISVNRISDELQGLSLGDATMAPAFDPATSDYTVTVGNDVAQLDLTPVLFDKTATLVVDGNPATDGQPVTLDLQVGDNPVAIVVTAQDGSTKTYNVTITRSAPSLPGGGGGGAGGGSSTGGGTIVVTVKSPGNSSSPGNTLTKLVGANLQVSGEILSADGHTLLQSNIKLDADGNLQVGQMAPGTYRLVLYVTAPNGQKLAGQAATLTMSDKGTASVQFNLIDPFGTVRDSLTNQPIDGVKVSLYWADTAANRAAGHTPGTLVQLPELVNMLPNQNHNAQTTTDGGQYGFMVFPQGDYYLIAEKDGYQTYDSRNDTRDETQGDTSYIRNGIIHVGQTVVQMNFTMQAQAVSQGAHQPYISGYPDGTFRPNQSITRAELASILARILPAGDSTTNAMSFHDVASSYWAAQAIAEISGQKIMVGYPDGNFHPNLAVTRAEMADVLAKLKQLPTAQGKGFSDIAGNWAENFILQVQTAGLVSGYPDGTYRPNQALTRAETVVILNKLLGRTPQQVTGSPKWSDVPATFWGYVNIMEASEAHSYQTLANGVEVWTH